MPRNLISTFVVCCIDSIIPLVSISEISSLHRVSVAAQAGLCLYRSQTPKTGFLVTRLNYVLIRWLKYCFKCKYQTKKNLASECFSDVFQTPAVVDPDGMNTFDLITNNEHLHESEVRNFVFVTLLYWEKKSLCFFLASFLNAKWTCLFAECKVLFKNTLYRNQKSYMYMYLEAYYLNGGLIKNKRLMGGKPRTIWNEVQYK